MGPIALSLDIFQSEKNCFLGFVLPTLYIMHEKIKNISHLKHCTILKQTILESYTQRFSYIIDLEKESFKIFLISAISHPKFKLCWIPNEYTSMCKTLFLDECKTFGLHNEFDGESDVSNSSHTTDNDFFDNYLSQHYSPINENEKNKGLVQGLLYLDSKN